MKNVYDLDNYKVQYLIKSDKNLGLLIKYIKTCELYIEVDGFKCLIKYIIGQQISDKARETIWNRFCINLKEITPLIVLNVPDNKFMAIGISYRKIMYIKELAKYIIENNIDFKQFEIMNNEDIIKILTSINGIGRWTAEMYLIFSLGRENILSKGDGTIKRTIQWMYNLKDLPTQIELEKIFKKWNKYSTIVSAFLWKSIELGLTQKSFYEIIKI